MGPRPVFGVWRGFLEVVLLRRVSVYSIKLCAFRLSTSLQVGHGRDLRQERDFRVRRMEVERQEKARKQAGRGLE